MPVLVPVSSQWQQVVLGGSPLRWQLCCVLSAAHLQTSVLCHTSSNHTQYKQQGNWYQLDHTLCFVLMLLQITRICLTRSPPLHHLVNIRDVCVCVCVCVCVYTDRITMELSNANNTCCLSCSSSAWGRRSVHTASHTVLPGLTRVTLMSVRSHYSADQ